MITIHILSDSLGETADAVARAAVAQFPRGTFRVERLPSGNTRVRAQQLTGNPWSEDPGCYLSDEEIGLDPTQAVPAKAAARVIRLEVERA